MKKDAEGDKKRKLKDKGVAKKVENVATLRRRFGCGMDLDIYGCGVYSHPPEYRIEKG